MLDLGPDWYLASTPSNAAYARADSSGTLAEQLDALVGTHVTVEVGPVDNERGEVYTLNHLPWRELSDAPPPWVAPRQLDRRPTAAAASRMKAKSTAARTNPHTEEDDMTQPAHDDRDPLDRSAPGPRSTADDRAQADAGLVAGTGVAGDGSSREPPETIDTADEG